MKTWLDGASRVVRPLAAVLVLAAVAAPPARADLRATYSVWVARFQPFCSGADCCFNGSTDEGATCVSAEWEAVVNAKGQPSKVRKLTKHARKRGELSLTGMADENGRTLIPPRYDNLQALSATLAWARKPDGSEVLVDSGGKERPLPFRGIEILVGADDLPLLVFGTDEPGAKTQTLHQLGPDGAPTGVTLPNVVNANSTGALHVVNMEGADGKAGMIFGRNGRALSIGAQLQGVRGSGPDEGFCERSSVDYAKPQLMMEVGPSPVTLYPNAMMYIPVDANGQLAALPEGVMGVVPHFFKNGCASAFIAVQRVDDAYEYRMGGPNALKTIQSFSTLQPLIDIRSVTPDHVQTAKYLKDWDLFLTIRPKATGLWALTDGVKLYPGFETMTADRPIVLANAEIERRYQAELAKNAQIAADAARAASLRAEQIARFEGVFSKPGIGDEEMLRSLASSLRGDYAERYWVRYGKGLEAYNMCNAGSPTACSVSAQQAEDARDEFAAKREEEAAFRYALSNGWTVPEIGVRVTGPGIDSTMSLSEYNRIYGD